VNRIIVSDDSTDDASRLLIEREFPGVFLLSGPKRGLGANRNNAIAAVEGDFVIFLDDDAMLDRNFIAIAQAFAGERSLDLTTIILTGIEMTNGREVLPSDQNFLGYQRRPYHAGEALNTLVMNSALIPAQAARRIGFDELLVYGYDEVDFALRARAQNISIMFCPGLRNQHFPSAINREFYRPFTDASRIYVTFKRYRMLENSIPKAWLYLAIASLHLFAANLKRSGLDGVLQTWKSLRKVYAFKNQFAAQ
jgi:GT2 family glycosyltransferase